MPRIHGRNGIAYIGLTTGAAASPVAFLSDYTINFVVNKVDVTAMGDPNLIYVAGLPDASGDFSGFYDTTTTQTYAAATDGLPRNFYLYPNTNTATEYFTGTIIPDFSVTAGVAAAAAIKVTWNAASSIQRMRAGVIG